MFSFLLPIAKIFISFPWTGFYDLSRVVFIILDVALVAALVYTWQKAQSVKPQNWFYGIMTSREAHQHAFDVPRYRKHWNDIRAHAEDAPPQSLTLAVIAGDNLVDDALKEMGLQGEHMADRLEQLHKADLPSLDDLWRAHRVRNDLVHTVGFTLTPNETREVLDVYEKFLLELGALE
jgi:hypothetical protein